MNKQVGSYWLINLVEFTIINLVLILIFQIRTDNKIKIVVQMPLSIHTCFFWWLLTFPVPLWIFRWTIHVTKVRNIQLFIGIPISFLDGLWNEWWCFFFLLSTEAAWVYFCIFSLTVNLDVLSAYVLFPVPWPHPWLPGVRISGSWSWWIWLCHTQSQSLCKCGCSTKYSHAFSSLA